jgi:hypothetical protein
MTTKLKWRLSKLPTPLEVTELLREKIISQEEAREILFNKDGDGERDDESLKEEIKFLRGLVDKLSNGRYTTVYEYVYKYPSTPWVQPYMTWCSGYVGSASYLTSANTASSLGSSIGSSQANMIYGLSSSAGDNQLLASYQNGTNTLTAEWTPTTNFTDIKTF